MKYFVTHGQGLEPFVLSNAQAINERFSDQFSLTKTEKDWSGKIVFEARLNMQEQVAEEEDEDKKLIESNIKIAKVLSDHFKSVERLFGFVYLESDINQIMLGSAKHKNQRVALTDLYNFILKIGASLSPTLEQWAQIYTNLQEQEVPDGKDEDDEISNKRQKLEENYSFRIDAKVTGRFKNMFKSNQIAKCIGSALVKSLSKDPSPNKPSWGINLSKPTLSLTVYITEMVGFLCGVSLSTHPLSERQYLNTIPGRSTIAYSLSSLVVSSTTTSESNNEEVKTEDDRLKIILDPMCGQSTILIELMKSFSHKVLFACGMDKSTDQISQSTANIEKSGEFNKIMTVLHDSTRPFPLRRDLLFDGIVCDFPFGVQYESYEYSVKNLPIVFDNMNNCVKPGGNIVLLISLALSTNLEKFSSDIKWRFLNKYPVKLGALQAVIYHYIK